MFKAVQVDALGVALLDGGKGVAVQKSAEAPDGDPSQEHTWPLRQDVQISTHW